MWAGVGGLGDELDEIGGGLAKRRTCVLSPHGGSPGSKIRVVSLRLIPRVTLGWKGDPPVSVTIPHASTGVKDSDAVRRRGLSARSGASPASA